MKKRISSLLLALVMCLSLLPTAAFAEGDTDTDPDGGTTITDMDAADTPMVQSVASQPAVTAAEHSHCICGTTHSAIGNHSAENVQTWASTTSLPASAGCYCLQNSVTLSSTWSAPAGDVYLCLNGYTITAGGDFPVITVTNGATLYLTDCQGTGKITHVEDKTGSGAKVESGGNFSLFNGSITGNTTDNGGGVYIASGGTFSLYGGSITGNTATGQDVAEGGGGVYIEDSSSTPGGTFNMYGGSITGNTATGTGTESQFCGGGGVLVGNYSTFNMTGGEISGNHAANRGGGVYIVEPADNHINFTMSGGEITGNNAAGLGGGVYGAGAYHAIDTSTSPHKPSSTPGSTFTISGTAKVIGNTLGGTKGTDGKYTGGTANNMYLPSWAFSIHVASDFTGSFGVTVAEDDWARTWDGSTGSTRKGSLWKVVRYEGTSDFPGFNYDNQHFTLIKRGDDRGMLQCNHYNSTSAACTICDAALNVEMTITPAGGTSSTTYYENLSAAANYINNKTDITGTTPVTIKLLNSVTDTNNTVRFFKPCLLTIDLNDKTLTGNVCFEASRTASWTLTMNGSGTLSGILTINSGTAYISNGSFSKLAVYNNAMVQLTGGTFGEVINNGNNVYTLLAPGYAYQSTADRSWNVPNTSTYRLANVSVQTAPITNVSVSFAAGSSQTIPYGGSTTLTAAVTTPTGVTGTVTYQWYRHKDAEGAPTEKLEGATGKTYTATGLGGGTYYFYCDATVDGYTMRGSMYVTVNKPTLSSTIKPTAVENLTFSTTSAGGITSAVAQQLVTAPADLPKGCTVYYRLGETGTFVPTLPTATNAGEYTVYWYINGGDDYENMGSAASPAGTISVTIAPKAIDSEDITAAAGGCTYTGQPITPTLTVKDGSMPLTEGTDYTLSDDAGKTAVGSYTLTITGKNNYTGERKVQWTITPKPPEDDAPANDTPNTPHRHDPIRRQPLFISAIGDSGNASGSGSGVASPDTGDAGIALYGAMAVLSLTGGAWVRRRKNS